MTSRETWGKREEAARLGISVRHLDDMVKKHQPPVLRFGAKVMFDEAAHQALCAATGKKDNPDYIVRPVVPKVKLPRNWNKTKAARAEAAARIAVVSKDKILAAAQPMPATGTGVYFLISAGMVVYVGQAVNVLARIFAHTREKKFDSWSWLPCQLADLDAMERAHINAMLPELNRDFQVCRLRRERRNA